MIGSSQSPLEMFLCCILITILVITSNAIKAYKIYNDCIKAKILEDFNNDSYCCDSNVSSLKEIKFINMLETKNNVNRSLWLSLFALFDVTIMLIIMSFNIFFILSSILGIFISNLLFGHIFKLKSDVGVTHNH